MARTDFHQPSAYQTVTPTVGLMPFRFARLDASRYILTNDLGDHALLSTEDFQRLVSKTLDPNSATYLDLRSKSFVSDDRASVHARILASRYRTKKAFL